MYLSLWSSRNGGSLSRRSRGGEPCDAVWRAVARFAEMEPAGWPAPAVTDGATAASPQRMRGSSALASLDHRLWGGDGLEFEASL